MRGEMQLQRANKSRGTKSMRCRQEHIIAQLCRLASVWTSPILQFQGSECGSGLRLSGRLPGGISYCIDIRKRTKCCDPVRGELKVYSP